MIQNIEVKTLFEDQIHERQQFSLKIEGNIYQGIYHEDEIQWFHPHPRNILNDGDLEEVETEVYDLMTNKDLEHFEVRPLFKNQIHERQQFSLNIEGNVYHGIYHEDEIQWFHPHPRNVLKDEEQKNKRGFDQSKTDAEFSKEFGSANANRAHKAKAKKRKVIEKSRRMERHALKCIIEIKKKT